MVRRLRSQADRRKTEFIVEAPKEGQRLEDCRILVALVGRPEHDATWLSTIKELGEELENLEENLDFAGRRLTPRPHGNVRDNRRGNFNTATVATSYGGGQTVSTLFVLVLSEPLFRCRLPES